MHELDLVVWNHARFFKTSGMVFTLLLRDKSLEFQLFFGRIRAPTGFGISKRPTFIVGHFSVPTDVLFWEPKVEGWIWRIMWLTLPSVFHQQVQVKWIEKYAAEWDIWGQIRCPLDIPIWSLVRRAIKDQLRHMALVNLLRKPTTCKIQFVTSNGSPDFFVRPAGFFMSHMTRVRGRLAIAWNEKHWRKELNRGTTKRNGAWSKEAEEWSIWLAWIFW